MVFIVPFRFKSYIVSVRLIRKFNCVCMLTYKDQYKLKLFDRSLITPFVAANRICVLFAIGICPRRNFFIASCFRNRKMFNC